MRITSIENITNKITHNQLTIITPDQVLTRLSNYVSSDKEEYLYMITLTDTDNVQVELVGLMSIKRVADEMHDKNIIFVYGNPFGGDDANLKFAENKFNFHNAVLRKLRDRYHNDSKVVNDYRVIVNEARDTFHSYLNLDKPDLEV